MLWPLAASSLRRRPLRTVLTALGIAVAVGSMVIFLSLGEGLRQVFSSELGAVGPDIQVSFGDVASNNPYATVPNLPLSVQDELRAVADEYGITGITPVLVNFRGGFDPSSAVIFQGLPSDIDPAEFMPGFELIEGRWYTVDGSSGPFAVIGQATAERMGLGLGRTLRLNPRSSFEIVGVASSDGGFVDNSVLVPLPELAAALGVEDRVSYLGLDLAEPATAATVADRLGERFPDLSFQTRGELLSLIERGLRISDAVRLGISGIALLVGAIAVANTLLMSVFERTREFAVLRAVGARPRFLLGLVLAESVLLSVAGAVVGLLLGRLGVAGLNALSDNLVGLDVAALSLRLALFAVAVAIAIGLVSGLVPAARAARVPIATAIAKE